MGKSLHNFSPRSITLHASVWNPFADSFLSPSGFFLFLVFHQSSISVLVSVPSSLPPNRFIYPYAISHLQDLYIMVIISSYLTIYLRYPPLSHSISVPVSVISSPLSLLCHLSPSCPRTRGPVNCIDIDVRLSCRCCRRRVLLTFSLRRFSLHPSPLSLSCPLLIRSPPVFTVYPASLSVVICFLYCVNPLVGRFHFLSLLYSLARSLLCSGSLSFAPCCHRGPLSRHASCDLPSLELADLLYPIPTGRRTRGSEYMLYRGACSPPPFKIGYCRLL